MVYFFARVHSVPKISKHLSKTILASSNRPTRTDRRSALRGCYGGVGGGNTSSDARTTADSARRFFMDRWEGWPRRQKEGRTRTRQKRCRTKAFNNSESGERASEMSLRTRFKLRDWPFRKRERGMSPAHRRAPFMIYQASLSLGN